MEENIEFRNISNEELLDMYKNLIDFVKELEKEKERENTKQGEKL